MINTSPKETNVGVTRGIRRSVSAETIQRKKVESELKTYRFPDLHANESPGDRTASKSRPFCVREKPSVIDRLFMPGGSARIRWILRVTHPAGWQTQKPWILAQIC